MVPDPCAGGRIARSLSDPLGGALPPHRHSFDNSFGTVSTGAPSGDAPEGASVSRAPHPTDALRGERAAVVLPSGGCSSATSHPKTGRGLPATRGALEHHCQPRRLAFVWSR